MDYAELSDLEEGEILEYESCPSVSSEKSDQLRKKWRKMEDEEFRARIISPSKNDMGKEVGLNLKNEEENKGSERLEVKIDNYELDDILSSDEDAKYSIKTQNLHKRHKDKVKNMNYVSYGTVEDIMSQIGETISRKSKCNYKKRKSKDFRYSCDIVHQNKINFSDTKPYKIFSSHYSSRLKRERQGNDTDVDTFGKFYEEHIAKDLRSLKRKKKKKDLFLESKNEKEIFNIPNKKVVDFDEMRKILLEKLKKQKAEEELKNAQEMDNSEIQEVEMIIECTNYVDKPNPNGAPERNVSSEMSVDEEESDLMKLRSVALASKEKRRIVESLNETPEGNNMEKLRSFEVEELKKTENADDELDRSELLLRAEALKTALLKKHQKRLSKIRKEKVKNIINCDESQEAATFSSDEFLKNEVGNTEENVCKKAFTKDETDETSQRFDCNLDKENINEDPRPDKEESKEDNLQENKTRVICSANSGLKKYVPKSKVKKKKRKSFSLECHVKENDKNETPEEDDKTLRFQLLTDLLKKKSQKNSDGKCVILDSIQTPSNSPVESNTNEEMKVQPVTVQNNLVKKNCENQMKKPIRVPKPEIQRIIVHLGPDESSDEEPELFSLPHASRPGVETQKFPTNDEATVANYEKNVDLLLSRARQKIEEEMKKANDVILTPEAVYKHLPPSQRLEYIRLKQKIAERERLKKLKKENLFQTKIATKSFDTGTVNFETLVPKVSRINAQNDLVSSSSNAYTNTTTFVDTQIKFGKNNGGILSSTGRKTTLNKTLPSRTFNLNKAPEHRKTLNSLVFNNSSTLGKKQNFKSMSSKKYVAPNKVKSCHQSHFLRSSNQGIATKLKLLLKKIKIEKTIEENYEKEIVKLKSQISIFEKKKSEQQFKIKKLAEESMKIYKLLQTNKKESSNPLEPHTKEKKEGTILEKSAVELKQVVEEQNSPVQQGIVQENPKLHIIENGKAQEMASIKAEVKCSGAEHMEYNSPLQVFNKASEESQRVDPNVIMCQFDLMGVCKDEECSYQHLDRKCLDQNLRED